MSPKYKRILLKLSGEVLAGERRLGHDFSAMERICEEVAEVSRAGVEVAMVIGGGNFMRGAEIVEHGVERVQADQMGMLATVINGLALQSTLEQLGVPTRVQSAIEMRALAETFIRRRAIRHLEKGRVVIFVGGTGSPYFTTDTTAALRASEIDADCLIKATKVDGIYDKDPVKDPTAVRLARVSYREAIERHLRVMDAAAFALCEENKIPIVVFDIHKKGDLEKLIVFGEEVGSVVE